MFALKLLDAAAPRSRSRRRARRHVPPALTLVMLSSVLAGCGIDAPPTIATIGGREAGARLDHAPEAQRIEALTTEMTALSGNIDPAEASRCADRAVRYTTLLTRFHRLTRSAEFNSFLVNIGVKRRGQCFQLADDLNAELAEQNYRTLVFTRAIVYRDEWFREHNCIVVTAPGQPFADGLVLDPWRIPGVLRFARVKLDQYPWAPRNPPTTPAMATTKPVKPDRATNDETIALRRPGG